MDLHGYNNIDEFAEKIISIYNSNSKKDICIVGKFDLMKKLLRSFLLKDTNNNFVIKHIEIEEPSLDYYDKEYYFEIADNEIWISKANSKERNNYLYTMCSLLFIEQNSYKDISDYIDYEQKIDFYIVDRMSDTIKFYENEEQNIYGFMISNSTDTGVWHTSFFTSDKEIVYKEYKDWKSSKR